MTQKFKTVLWAHATDRNGAWLDRIWPSAEETLKSTSFRAAFSGMARRMRPAELSNADREALRDAGVAAPERWRVDDVGRAALLVDAMAVLAPDGHAGFVREVYLRGDFREQAAVLKSLPFLPDCARFVDMAIDACRTNVLDVFEAIAYENPFPARHFPDANFNQLVMKAIFMGLTVDRIVGLAARNSGELKRMATDFAAERRAAGRPVPDDIDFIASMAIA